MKKNILLILLTLTIAVPLTWFVARKIHSASASQSRETSGKAERKIRYYQSAMHPWIKSDKPGRCTICGMELTPVYEGDPGFEASGGSDIVPLTQTMVQVLHVQVEEAQMRPLRKTLNVAGTIDDNNTRHRVLSSYIPGRIDKLHVNYVGAEVQEGQPLAEFYSPDLLQAEREYRLLSKDLREITALRLKQMGLTEAQINNLENKPENLLSSQILAPIGGTVVAQNVYEGQYVQEGEKLFEIGDFSTMWFQFEVYEQDLPWIKPDLKVEMTTPSHPGRTFDGTITFVDPNFNASTRSTKVRVEVENPVVDGRRPLFHRLYAEGRVHLDAPEVLTVPRSAVIQTGAEAVAYVDQGGGTYSRRVLKLGRRGDEFLEVISGVSQGEKVVVNGNLLIDGQAEMNRTFAAPATPEPEAKEVSIKSPLNEQQQKVMNEFLSLVDGMGTALANDNLADFNALTSKTHSIIPHLLATFRQDDPWYALITQVNSSGHLSPATDLAQARKAFHPLSQSSVALASQLVRTQKEFSTVKIFRCPMTGGAFPGAPAASDWIQLNPNLRNPWFGSQMSECGEEIKP